MECKNCGTALYKKYQINFCSTKCGSQYASKIKVPKQCPSCKKILYTKLNCHLQKCNAIKKYSNICSFGCGRPATKFFKNGKSCCSSSTGPCHAYQRSLWPKRQYDNWNKNKKKKSDRVYIVSDETKEKIREKRKYHIVPPHTEETKKKLSIIAKNRNLGGYIKGSGRGKKGWYKGIFCDSSWELAFVMYHFDHNIKIARCTEKRYYEWKGQILTYIPDFVVNNTTYEIKGYNSDKWQAKYKNNQDIIVLYHTEMKYYLKYAIDTYGKNFINRYENDRNVPG